MSSDHEESLEVSGDVIIKSDAEKEGSSPTKKAPEYVKGKRRGRRGKKRKQRKSGGAAESETQEDSPAWDSDQDFEIDQDFSDVMIRPVDVPKAPENSTQYIIDDHNQCHLYFSFETPNSYQTESSAGDSGIVNGPAEYDAAYFDVDFQYDPPDDFDSGAYYDKEFELSYKSNRFDQLSGLSRQELIEGLRSLESKLKELSDDLVKENPSPTLENLQSELLDLQEKHTVLQDTNTKITSLMPKTENKVLVQFGLQDLLIKDCESKLDQAESLDMETEDDHKCSSPCVEENHNCDLAEGSSERALCNNKLCKDETALDEMNKDVENVLEDIDATLEVQRTHLQSGCIRLNNLQQKFDRLHSELGEQCNTEDDTEKTELVGKGQLNNEVLTSSDMDSSAVLRDCRGCEENAESEQSAPVAV